MFTIWTVRESLLTPGLISQSSSIILWKCWYLDCNPLIQPKFRHNPGWFQWPRRWPIQHLASKVFPLSSPLTVSTAFQPHTLTITSWTYYHAQLLHWQKSLMQTYKYTFSSLLVQLILSQLFSDFIESFNELISLLFPNP